MIGIVSYGLGNVSAIANIYKRLGMPACLASTPEQLQAADRLILPGVGAFDWAMNSLNASGMRAALEDAVHRDRKPLLGICVGMQMLAERSEEGREPGLGWVPGEVRRFDVSRFDGRTHLPHMGWNDVECSTDCGLFRGLESDARFYFLHSYYFAPSSDASIIARADYCGRFACGVGAGNVMGVQFHPEKSHDWGVTLLRNFGEL